MIAVNFLDARLPERFWTKAIPEPMSGCWLWLAARAVRGGYGQFRLGASMLYAHVLAYRTLVGRIDDGLELDHRCRTRCCINPLHLEPVTHLMNVRRGSGRGGALWVSPARCRRGHSLIDDNDVYLEKTPTGTARKCRVCRAQNIAKFKAKGIA